MLLVAVSAQAQREYATWVLGSDVRLTFVTTDGMSIGGPRMIAPTQNFFSREGSAVYANACTGDLIMYASGNMAFNTDGSRVAGDIDLTGGTSSAQAGIIVGDPGDSSRMWFIVAPDLTDDLGDGRPFAYAANHVRLRPDGRCEFLQRDIPMTMPGASSIMASDSGSERIAATFAENNKDIWIAMVTTQYSQSDIVLRKITASGLEPTVLRTPLTYPVAPAGAVKFSPDGRFLAVVDVAQSSVFLYSFNKSTGELRGPTIASLSPIGPFTRLFAPYGLSFSMSGESLYVACAGSRVENEAAIVRLATNVRDNAEFSASLSFVGAASRPLTWPGMLQLGPDGSILHAHPEGLGRIVDPDAISGTPNYVSRAVLAPSVTTIRNGLPSCNEATFLKSYKAEFCQIPRASIQSHDTCAGSCVRVTGSVSMDALRATWRFPGGVPSVVSGLTPPDTVCFDSPGTYIISVLVTNTNGSYTAYDTVTIHPMPSVNAGPDRIVCHGGTTRLQARGASQYRWSPATFLSDSTSNSPVVSGITQPMTYVLYGWNVEGCVVTDTVNVSLGELVGRFSNDTTICEGGSATLVAEGGTTCRWLDDSTFTGHVRTVQPRTTTRYYAVVSDGTCSDTISVSVAVVARPQIMVLRDTTICSGESVVLFITDDHTLSISITGSPGNTPRVFPDTATSYIITATTQTGCTITDTVVVNVIDRFLTAMNDTTVCVGSDIGLRALSNGPVTWSDLSGTTLSSLINVQWDTVLVAATPAPCQQFDTIRITAVQRGEHVTIDTAACNGSVARFDMSSYGTPNITAGTGSVSGGIVSIPVAGRTVVEGSVGNGTECSGTFVITVQGYDRQQLSVSVPSFEADHTMPFDIPITIQSVDVDIPATVTITSSSASLRIDPAYTAPIPVLATTSGQTLQVRGQLFLDLSQSFDVIARITPNVDCAEEDSATGIITRIGCASLLRPIRLFDEVSSQAVYSADEIIIEIRGGASITQYRLIDVLGRTVFTGECTSFIRVDRHSMPATLFVVLDNAGTRMIHHLHK